MPAADRSSSDDIVKQVRELSDAVAVDISGDVDLHRSPALRETLAKLIDANPARLVLNLSEVGYMDSSGVATLVEALQRIQRKQGRLLLHSLSPRVQSIFEIARLESIFEIYPSEDEALRA